METILSLEILRALLLLMSQAENLQLEMEPVVHDKKPGHQIFPVPYSIDNCSMFTHTKT